MSGAFVGSAADMAELNSVWELRRAVMLVHDGAAEGGGSGEPPPSSCVVLRAAAASCRVGALLLWEIVRT